MMVLMIATILASLALGVTIAYGVCSALFTVFRIHSRAKSSVPLRMRAKMPISKIAHL